MKRQLFIVIASALTLAGAQAQTTVEWPKVTREMKAGSRWWWMGSAVDRDNLQWQMQQLAQAGIGQLEITPIYGVQGNSRNNIPFLSRQWLDMLSYTQQLGQQLDIDIDMTTGTGWPSGGPMVTREQSASKLVTETQSVTGDGTTQHTIRLTTQGAQLQRVVAYRQDGEQRQTEDLTARVAGSQLTWQAPAGQWTVIAAYCQPGVMQVKRPQPGSEGYVVDYFDHDAVAAYLSYFDQRFADGGEPWPHAFFNDSYEINQADWTPRMFEQFEMRRGYKLEEHLDQLLNRDRQVYADYRQTLSDMLQHNFTRQWAQWARSHGALARNQAHGSPGNLIDLYAEADIPEAENFYMNNFGLRGLRDDRGFYMTALSSKATLKYASSAAHITGKRLISSESMTWLTEHFRTSLSQLKPELDLLFSAGVNHVIFHGTAYSPREAQWPGWKFYAAIDMSPTNSIWRDAPAMMKYVERVQSMMQTGQPDNDVLVYAPFAYAMHRNDGLFQSRMALFDINTLSQKMGELELTQRNLEALGLDCDYTSEYYLMRTTFVDGALQTEAGTRYQALVVPVSDYLPDSLAAHLKQLEQQGAQIVYGRQTAELSTIAARPEPMRSLMGLSVLRRRDDNGYHYFLANLTPKDVEGYVALAVDFADAYWMNPLDGGIRRATLADDGRLRVALRSGESMLLQTLDQTAGDAPAAAADTTPTGEIIVGGPWTLSFTDAEPLPTGSYLMERPQTWETLDAETARLMGTGAYETTFALTASQLQAASGGFRLELGDVRESARVWVNGQYLGCAWAVPYSLDCGDALHEGENTLRIEVTNLPANRISQMDRDGIVWRIFEDINMANISTDTYAGWAPVPSGLASAVRLVPMATLCRALDLRLERMVEATDGQAFYPLYSVRAHNGQTVSSIALSTSHGEPFTDFATLTAPDGTVGLVMKGHTDSPIIVSATAHDGQTLTAFVQANGAYDRTLAVDFTLDTPPGGGWNQLASTSEIMGFSGTGKLPWCRSKLSGTQVTGLYEGLTFSSDKSNYYFYFPGYGMYANNDFVVTVGGAQRGDLCQVAYLKGEGTTVYQAADSLHLFAQCDDAGLAVSLPGNKSYQIYRSLAVFRPQQGQTAIRPVSAQPASGTARWHTLQGTPVSQPRRGIYIDRQGRKVIIR